MEKEKTALTLEDVVALVRQKSLEIAKEYRYPCGLESLEKTNDNMYRGFFLSPDSQNGRLFYALRDCRGMSNGQIGAEYYWKIKVVNANIFVSYTEGDIAVYEIVNAD